MQKLLKGMATFSFAVCLFGMSSHTVGQGKEEFIQHKEKQLTLTHKELSKGFTIQTGEGRSKTEYTEGTLSVNHIPNKPKPIPKPKPNYRELTVEATAYVSFCDTGCIGITFRGTNVKNTIYHESGLPIIATDPNIIPLGSIVEINGTKYIADDTGGAIKGHRIDILVATHDTSKAYKFGRQKMKIKVFN